MIIIVSATVQCDDCGRILRRLVGCEGWPWVWTDTPNRRKHILRRLGMFALRRNWRMEGQPSQWAGDLCNTCLVNEMRVYSTSTP